MTKSQERAVNLDRYRIELRCDEFLLAAEEPTAEELASSAGTFAQWYSDEHNRGMMGGQAMTRGDALDCFEAARSRGDRVFFLYRDARLVGDADLRNLAVPDAEFAIMVGARDLQGQGLGTTFSRLIHHFGFAVLGLETVYLTVLSQNVAGQRCYEKLGYSIDRSPAALAYTEEETDVPMSVTRKAFHAKSGEALRGARIKKR